MMYTLSKDYFCVSSTEDSNNAILLYNLHKIGIHQGGLLSQNGALRGYMLQVGMHYSRQGWRPRKRHGSSLKMHAVSIHKHKRDA